MYSYAVMRQCIVKCSILFSSSVAYAEIHVCFGCKKIAVNIAVKIVIKISAMVNSISSN